eukprot:309250-Amphidinium_carterae.1
MGVEMSVNEGGVLCTISRGAIVGGRNFAVGGLVKAGTGFGKASLTSSFIGRGSKSIKSTTCIFSSELDAAAALTSKTMRTVEHTHSKIPRQLIVLTAMRLGSITCILYACMRPIVYEWMAPGQEDCREQCTGNGAMPQKNDES